jgi:type II secretory pathway component PulF
LPRFADLLGGAGAALPRSTAVLIAFSDVLRRYWPTLLALPALVVGFALWARTSGEGARVLSMTALGTPLLGALRRQALAARFARLTAVLLRGGAPLLTALDDTHESLADPVARDEVSRLRERVREGAPLNRAIAEGSLFPPLLAQLVAVGEESGRLHDFLAKSADLFERRTEDATARLVALAEPAMIVTFGLVVGFVALSLLQAVYGVNAGAFR